MPRLLIGPLLRHVGHTDATVWVETDEPCEVEILGHREHTWTVAGHHYALVTLSGLEPGSSDARTRCGWTASSSGRRRAPRARRRVSARWATDRPLRLAFGSCRYGRAAAEARRQALRPRCAELLVARCSAREDESQWPDALILLGDQVYADETSAATQRRIRAAS